MNCQLRYVSANCVPTPGAADCSKSNIIAYASSNSVLLYDFQYGSGGKIVDTLVKHSDTVRSLRWIRADLSQKAQDLISGGSDGRLVFWTVKEGSYTPLVINHYKNDKQEKEIISSVDGYCKGNKIIVCCLTLKVCEIWERQGDEDFVLKDSFKRTSISLRITYWQHKQKFILASATAESKINIISQDSINGRWFICQTLLGHENWVNGLDFTTDENGDLLLASASQDATIRLWRFCSLEISNVSNQCVQQKGDFNVYLESVINGHEGWIYSVCWNPVKMQLLSASLDKSIIIWEIDKDTGLWLEKARLGEVGGNTLGFYGGFYDSHGHQVIGYSYHGAFHIWKESDSQWVPAVQLGGHFKGVVDMSWDPDGECLFSVSHDQTARVYAPWSVDNKEVTWHELARPQVHGYDLSSIAVLSKYQYVSGAEEKVIRLFKAPVNFKENFYRICKNAEYNNSDNEKTSYNPRGASVPSLGLSNKAVYKDDNEEDSKPLNNKNPYPEESRFSAQYFEKPPTEETLLENTLWPEEQKLYGHCYEIYCLAASPDGKYLASASRATVPLHAEIFIWDTATWKICQRLLAHSLTVVQMQFSPNSRHLLSVSRDRRWALFTNRDGIFELTDTSDKIRVHTRIIWTCAWSHDSEHFGTGSRDGIVSFWTEATDSESSWKAHSPLKFAGESVTALAMAPGHINSAYLCAIGFEKGEIKLYKVCLNASEESYDLLLHLPARKAHHLTIKRLAFRPRFGIAGNSADSNKNVVQLASCSLDTSVRIYDLTN